MISVIQELKDKRAARISQALALYNARYDNALYIIATYGQSVEFCMLLVNDALALCDDPHYFLDADRYLSYSKEAHDFLRCFRG